MGYYIHDIVLRIATESSDPRNDWDWESLLSEEHVVVLDNLDVDYIGGDLSDYDPDDFSEEYDKKFRNADNVECQRDHLDDHYCECNERHMEDHECDECDRVHAEDLDRPYASKLDQWLHHADWCMITNEWKCGCGLNQKLDEMNIGGLMTNG